MGPICKPTVGLPFNILPYFTEYSPTIFVGEKSQKLGGGIIIESSKLWKNNGLETASQTFGKFTYQALSHSAKLLNSAD